jgi:hypothetical protein
VQPRDRAPGAADRVEIAAPAALQDRGMTKFLADDLLCVGDGFLRQVLQREAAERQRDAGFQPVPAHVGQFQRAAAEVADDAVGFMESGNDSERGQFRLALAGQHADRHAARCFGPLDEIGAVMGVPDGCGGDGPSLADAHRVAQGAESAKRRQRLFRGVGREQAGRQHLAAESGQDLLVENRRLTAGQPLVDDEADRVRADVDDSNGRPVIDPALRQDLRRRRCCDSGCWLVRRRLCFHSAAVPG